MRHDLHAILATGQARDPAAPTDADREIEAHTGADIPTIFECEGEAGFRAREAAAQGVDFLRRHLWDAEQGGFHSLVTREGTLVESGDHFTGVKTAYGNAFAIYGLAAYHAASGDTAALGLAQRTFRWLDAGAHDAVHGGYFQVLQRDGTPMPARNDWLHRV